MIRSSHCASRRNANPKPRCGFTLVELVIVILIVGLLIAILLPSINMRQDPSRRTTCSYNQKNLALAIANYNGSRKRLPGYRDTLKTDAGSVPVSWTTMILPQIEQRHLYNQIKLGKTDPSDVKEMPYLELMACPSDPQDQSMPSTSYVANCGLPDKNPRDQAQIPLNWSADPTPAFAFNIPADWPANGPFVSRWEHDVDVGRLQKVDPATFYDGTTNTILLSESLDATVWIDTVSLSPAGQNGYVKLAPGVWNTPEISSGFIWTGEAKLKNNAGQVVNLVINGPTTDDGVATEMSHCRPSGKHPGGVNVTYADGRCVFINENIDYEVYSLLMTPDGRNATPNGEPFIETKDLPPKCQQYKVWRSKVVTSSDVP